MSKKEHDTSAAVDRSQIHSYDKPWYSSSFELTNKIDLKGFQCLDLCCGNCEFSEIVQSVYDLDITCADYIPLHIERAKSLGFETIEIDFDDDAQTIDQIASDHRGHFDIVFCLAAIEHIFNSDALFKFVHTVLKPNGYFLVNTPNIAFIGYRLYSLFSGNRPFGDGHHVRFWDLRFLRTNLYLNGFRIVDENRRFYTIPTDLALRTFRNRKGVSKQVARLFYACKLLQRVAFSRSWFTDELTLLCRKDLVFPVGFELPTVKDRLRRLSDAADRESAIARLKKARQRRWLDEHLHLSRFVDGL